MREFEKSGSFLSVICLAAMLAGATYGCGADSGETWSKPESEAASSELLEPSEGSTPTDEGRLEEELGSAGEPTELASSAAAAAEGLDAAQSDAEELATMGFGLDVFAGSCGGSWTDSCSGQVLGLTIRNATCFTRSGGTRFTPSFSCAPCGSGVANCDGRLICQGAAC